MQLIRCAKAPPPVGPYSHAVKVDRWVFISGQIGLDPATGALTSQRVEDQTAAALSNLEAILEEVGCSRKSVVKTTIFLTSMDHFSLVNEVYARFFGDHKPARSCVEVSRLPKGALVEIEAVAIL